MAGADLGDSVSGKCGKKRSSALPKWYMFAKIFNGLLHYDCDHTAPLMSLRPPPSGS